MTSGEDSSAVVGKFSRAARAPRGLRSALGLAEIDRAIGLLDEWRMTEAKIAERRWALVADLRRRGASWDSVGWLLGVTGDAVRQRFGPSLGEANADA